MAYAIATYMHGYGWLANAVTMAILAGFSSVILVMLLGQSRVFYSMVPESMCGSLTSIGTLFAFVIVAFGVILMRKSSPDLPRPFLTPFVPLVPILGMLVCAAMIIGLDPFTQLVAFVWMLTGLLIYFGYSRKRSMHQHV